MSYPKYPGDSMRARVIVELDITQLIREEDKDTMSGNDIKEFIQDSPELLQDDCVEFIQVLRGYRINE